MKPILFNTKMVRAILDGRKTQTRRIVKPQPPATTYVQYADGIGCGWAVWKGGDYHWIKAPYSNGDILYVRETWTKLYYVDPDGYTHFDQPMYYYAADGTPDITLRDADGFELEDQRIRWRPSIHMPKEAARLFLRVTYVCVERLWDMQPTDLYAEGVYGGANDSADAAYKSFSELWDSTIKAADRDRYSWNANPWVWVISFERIRKEAAE